MAKQRKQQSDQAEQGQLMLPFFEEGVVLKHSATVQITNTVTLLQRRIWNILLYNAFPNLGKGHTHQISMAQLVDMLDISTKNTSYLKKSLLALQDHKVQWNVLGKDDKDWGSLSMLGNIVVRRGTIYYSYGSILEALMATYNMWVRVNLSIQNRFNSKHALALWELFLDYASLGYTGEISIDKFRMLMGIGRGQYAEFKRLNEKVIQVGLEEVNKKTDLKVREEVTTEGNWAVAIRFHIAQQKELIAPPPPEDVILRDNARERWDALSLDDRRPFIAAARSALSPKLGDVPEDFLRPAIAAKAFELFKQDAA